MQSPLDRYVARLKDERAALEMLLDQLESEDVTSAREAIPTTGDWIEQVKVRLAKIDTFLKAIEAELE